MGNTTTQNHIKNNTDSRTRDKIQTTPFRFEREAKRPKVSVASHFVLFFRVFHACQVCDQSRFAVEEGY